jgi:hypothetical protein
MDMKPGLHNPKVLLRDTFIDAVNDPDFNATDAYFKFVYADIISFASGGAVSIDVPAGGAITLSARVITSDQALTLNFKPTSADLSAVILDAAVLDQPIAITFRGTVIDLELGPYTPNKGVQLEFSNGSLNLTYRTQYDPFTRVNVEGPGREALRPSYEPRRFCTGSGLPLRGLWPRTWLMSRPTPTTMPRLACRL